MERSNPYLMKFKIASPDGIAACETAIGIAITLTGYTADTKVLFCKKFLQPLA